MPVPLDEYPVHQVPLSMRHMATSDRNAYDRCYFNAHDRTGEVFLVTGMGVYPNLGVIDAYATVRRGDEQYTVRTSDALGDDRMAQRVGPYRIEVLEPLERVRVVCEGADHGVAFDLTWTGSFPPVEEPAHVMRQGGRVILDASRFAQVGTWSGVLRVGGEELAVSDDRWVGTRDRSWGIRPVGEAEPPGRAASEPDEGFGFWWTYVPLRFDDFAVVVIAQEDGDGTRLLNEAVRVFPAASGRPPEQLGWPEVEVRYRPGTRHPESAVLHMRTRGGKPAHPRDRDARASWASTAARATAATPTGRTASGGDGAGPKAWCSTCATPPSRAGSPSGSSTTWPGPRATGPRAGGCSSTGPSAATSRRASPDGNRWLPERRDRRRSHEPDGRVRGRPDGLRRRGPGPPPATATSCTGVW